MNEERAFQGNDRFEVIRCLGVGGMGVVYEVFDKRRQTRVALKTLRHLDAGAVARLKTEFRALQDLEHSNLVTLLELISDNDSWYFTMELVSGVSFLHWVRDSRAVMDFAPTQRDTVRETIHDTDQRAEPGADPQRASSCREPVASGLPVEIDVSPSAVTQVDPHSERRAPAPRASGFHEARLRSALRQLVAALAALHDAGKIHRDIKPSNLLVGEDGHLVLLDFGLVSDLNADYRSSLSVVGTVEYMAPEQAAARAVGPEADWYAVGVLLYEALTGQRPIDGHPLRILQDKQWKVPAAPRALSAEVPEDLDQLCMDLLRIDPRERPRQGELLERLSVETPSPSSLRPVSGPQSGVFVGRTRELYLLTEAFERSRQGQAQFVLVSGPSGVGKSALARQLTRLVEADAPELVVLRGRHYERESVPFRSADSIVDGLSRLLERMPAEKREAILPKDAGLLAQVFSAMRGVVPGGWSAAPGADRQELRSRLGVALRELIGNLAQRHPVIGIIDDVQWADSDSRKLLVEILHAPAPPITMILTLRTPPGDEALAAAWREGIRAAYGDAQHIDLQALSSEESRELAGRLLGDRLGSIDAIADEAGGHPLFIDALVRHTLLHGASAEHLRLDDALQARISELEPRTRLVLDLVVLAGGPMAADIIMRAGAIDYAEFTRRTATLRIAGLVRTTRVRGGEALESFHDRVRETVQALLSEDDRRAGHERLARALESSGGEAAALYLHHRGAGNKERASHYAAQAALEAAEALAFERAIGLYRSALKLSEDEGEKRRLRVRCGHALANAGRGPEAAEAFFSAVEGAPPDEALELRRLGAEQLLRAGKFAEGMEAARGVLAQVGMAMPKREWQAVLSFLWSRLRVRLRGLGFRERAPDEIPRAVLQRIDVCWSIAGVLTVADTLGAAPFQAKHLLSALSAGEPFRVARALALESGFLATAGKKSERRASAVAERANQMAQRLGDPYSLAWARGGTGVIATLNGRWSQGFTCCNEAEEIFRGHCGGFAWELATIQLFTLSSLFYLGRLEELSQRVTTGLREAEARGDAYLAQCHRTMPGIMSWLAAGDLAGARDQVKAPANQSSSRFHVEHCWRLISSALIDLYAGDGNAYQNVVERWPLVKSTLARVQLLRVEARLSRGRAALASGGAAEARQLARKVAREGAAWARPLGQLLEAGAAMAGAEDGPARSLLTSAVDGFKAAEMHLYAACAQRRLGRLIGGSEGAALIAEAAMRTVREPARVLAALAPGFPD